MNKRFGVKKLCVLGMLCALTVVLGFYATWRIGSAIKISLKFCPVFVSGCLFGPLLGGVVGTVSDIASFIANPAGGFLPLITIAEFLYGVVYGLFFYNRKHSVWIVLACTLTQAVLLDGIFKTYALTAMMGGSFTAMLYSRVISVVVNFIIQFAFVMIIKSYVPHIKKIVEI